MNIDEIINKPITTPEYPDPTVARRYLDDPDGFYGYDYVFLEDATWNALCEIAHERDCTVGELCSDIELNFAPGEPFTPAARHYVMRYLAGIPDNIELPGNFRVLSELLDERRHLRRAPDAFAFAEIDELTGIGAGLGAARAGTFGMNSDFEDETAEFAWITRLAKEDRSAGVVSAHRPADRP